MKGTAVLRRQILARVGAHRRARPRLRRALARVRRGRGRLPGGGGRRRSSSCRGPARRRDGSRRGSRGRTVAVATGRLAFTTDAGAVADARLVFICVPTPLHEGTPDLSFVDSAAASVADQLQQGSLVVLESTTYPGTTDERVRPAPRALPAGPGATSSWPTRPSGSTPATPSSRSVRTPRWSAGAPPERPAWPPSSTRSSWTRWCRSRPARAELAKLLENTFRHVNIALVNEMAMVCHEVGSTSGR